MLIFPELIKNQACYFYNVLLKVKFPNDLVAEFVLSLKIDRKTKA